MRIAKIDEDFIEFNTGDKITFDHEYDCCEFNYADFSQIDDLAKEMEFKAPLQFEKVDGSGFRFGNKNKMVFVPCYSVQNGYYTISLDIYYNGKDVFSLSCKPVDSKP